jgi:septal ring factor EnvC (AmiA/AmiB activator)
MGLIRRHTRRKQELEERRKLEEAMHQRAMRLVDTRGVVVRAAEAELQAAIAEVRAYATPEREQRLAEATRALEEARRDAETTIDTSLSAS